MSATDYPTLPKPNMVSSMTGLGYYGDDQMRAYVDADRAQRASLSTSKQAGAEPVSLLREAADYFAELYAKYQTKIGPFASKGQAINTRIGAYLRAIPPAVMPAAPSDAVPNGWRIIKTDEGFLVSAPLDGPGGLTVTPTDKALSARVLHALCFALSQTMQPQAEHRIAGLGFITDEDNGRVTLQFKDEKAANQFMKDYAPSVDIDKMPVSQPEPAAGEQAGAVASEGRCPNCDDTGDVNSITGEWRGVCHCPAGQAINARALAAPGAAIAAREEEAKVPKAGSFLMQRIDAAADALSEVLAFQRLNDDRKTKAARALSGLRGLQSIATPSAALTQPTTVQQAEKGGA